MVGVVRYAGARGYPRSWRGFAGILLRDTAGIVGGKRKGCAVVLVWPIRPPTFRVDSPRIRLPSINWVWISQEVCFRGRLKRVTVSREGERWFALVLVRTDDIQKVEHSKRRVAVDFGITMLAMRE
ncbi:hypothetical protein [Candidatus Methylacidithermus pantelleriae]|uniref:Transposase n=1 Tax=Candidatus Methylacidithermus pantelleriae TaxID=2744239 RepID=A0A8J2BQT0_9BACT|nr:hypothetical protein [Candidatus Methylacidithermus pantelleriae]CAF0702661.1 hypothetical protein MPNT_50149 [Candidatus Methylacidithermus pantelleriae]